MACSSPPNFSKTYSRPYSQAEVVLNTAASLLTNTLLPLLSPPKMAMVFAKNGRTSFGMNFQYWKGVVRIFVADTLKKERSGSTKETSRPKYFSYGALSCGSLLNTIVGVNCFSSNRFFTASLQACQPFG